MLILPATPPCCSDYAIAAAMPLPRRFAVISLRFAADAATFFAAAQRHYVAATPRYAARRAADYLRFC
jgi:hypothetical protein